MKRLKNKWVIGIFVIMIVVSGVIMIQRKTPFAIFLTKDYTTVTKDNQIAYLKRHEKEITDFVKSKNAKVTSLQWDWESVKIEEVQPNAGGIPTGDKYKVLDIKGKFNDIEDSRILLDFPFDKKLLYPNLKIFNIIDLSIIKEIDGTKGWVNYE